MRHRDCIVFNFSNTFSGMQSKVKKDHVKVVMKSNLELSNIFSNTPKAKLAAGLHAYACMPFPKDNHEANTPNRRWHKAKRR